MAQPILHSKINGNNNNNILNNNNNNNISHNNINNINGNNLDNIGIWPSNPSSYEWKGTISQSNNQWIVVAYCKEKLKDVVIKIKCISDESDDELSNFMLNTSNLIKLKEYNNLLLIPSHIFTYIKQIWLIYPQHSGGQISELLASHYPNGINDESITARILLDVLNGLKVMHNNQICHRELKASSLHLSKDEGITRLTEFGNLKNIKWSKQYKARNTMIFKQNPYISPELLMNNKDASWFKGDIYSFGVLAMELCFGQPPNTKKNVIDKQYYLPTKIDDYNKKCPYSKAFVDMVNSCTKDEDKRIKLNDLLEHTFFKKACTHDVVKQRLGGLLKSLESRINQNFKAPNTMIKQQNIILTNSIIVRNGNNNNNNNNNNNDDDNWDFNTDSKDNNDINHNNNNNINNSVPILNIEQPLDNNGNNNINNNDNNNNNNNNGNKKHIPHPEINGIMPPNQANGKQIISPKYERPVQHNNNNNGSPTKNTKGRFRVEISHRSSQSRSSNDFGDDINENASPDVSPYGDPNNSDSDNDNDSGDDTPHNQTKKGRFVVLTKTISDDDEPSTSSMHEIQLPKDVSQWTTKQSADWLSSLGDAYDKYREKWIENAIDGSMILSLDDEMLSEIIKSKLHRTKILNAKKKLLNQ